MRPRDTIPEAIKGKKAQEMIPEIWREKILNLSTLVYFAGLYCRRTNDAEEIRFLVVGDVHALDILIPFTWNEDEDAYITILLKKGWDEDNCTILSRYELTKGGKIRDNSPFLNGIDEIDQSLIDDIFPRIMKQE